jgi:hypothetical protein
MKNVILIAILLMIGCAEKEEPRVDFIKCQQLKQEIDNLPYFIQACMDGSGSACAMVARYNDLTKGWTEEEKKACK